MPKKCKEYTPFFTQSFFNLTKPTKRNDALDLKAMDTM